MDNPPSSEEQTTEPPAPEVLKPRSQEASEVGSGPPEPPKPPKRRLRAYRPSHKGTFIGLTAVVVVLALNAVIISVVLKHSKSLNSEQGQVTVNQAALSKLGVNQGSVGSSGVQLTIGPDTNFHGNVQVGGDLSVSGQFKLNNKLSAPDASLANLQAGKTALSELNVNGDSTLSRLSLRSDLSVNGTTRLQGPVTVSNLLTVNSNLNVSGNLSVGGTLAIGRISTNTLAISGHVTTYGSTPRVSQGSCVGSNGTVSISGNDQAGTVAVNVGAGACAGALAGVSFSSAYSGTPHVVVTPIGPAHDVYIARNSSGFTIYVATAPGAGGYAFDYIVEQ